MKRLAVVMALAATVVPLERRGRKQGRESAHVDVAMQRRRSRAGTHSSYMEPVSRPSDALEEEDGQPSSGQLGECHDLPLTRSCRRRRRGTG